MVYIVKVYDALDHAYSCIEGYTTHSKAHARACKLAQQAEEHDEVSITAEDDGEYLFSARYVCGNATNAWFPRYDAAGYGLWNDRNDPDRW